MDEELLISSCNIATDSYKQLVFNQCEQSIAYAQSQRPDIYFPIRHEAVPEVAKMYIIDFVIDKRLSSIYKYTINYAFAIRNESQRNRLVDYILIKLLDNDLMDEPMLDNIIYMNAIRKAKISTSLLKTIHDKFGTKFFNKNSKRFETMKYYCYIFSGMLTDYERELFSRRLQTKTRHQWIDKALTIVDFTDEQKRKLIAYEVLYNFSK